MTLANRLLSVLNESNLNDSQVISEAKSNEYKDMTLQEYFASVFQNNLESVEIDLDESNDGSDLYVDTQVSGVPLTFRFYVESESPMLDVSTWNDAKDESVVKTIKLSKRMMNESGDLVIEENLKHMPTEKILESVNKVVELTEVMKVVTRKDPTTGQIKKVKVSVKASDILKARKAAKLYRKKNKAKIEKQALKRDKKMDSRGYTSVQLMDINKRRKLKGMNPVDKFGKEIV